MGIPLSSKGINILIAEDDVAVAKGFQLILEKAGYRIAGLAHDGIQAMDLAIKTTPDFILMDIKMPRMDGLEAARRINQNNRKGFIPIVLVTAYADQKFVEKAKESGVLGFLVKPVHLDDLVPAVELAYSAAQRINALEGVVENLSQELESRKVVERAKGILMKRLNISEEEALNMMQKESRRQRIKLRDLAKAIISSDKVMS